MTISCPEFDGDSNTRKENWFGMTMMFDALTSLCKFQFIVSGFYIIILVFRLSVKKKGAANNTAPVIFHNRAVVFTAPRPGYRGYFFRKDLQSVH